MFNRNYFMNLHYIFPKIALYLLFTHAKKQFSFRLKNFLFIECGDWRPIWQLPTFEKLEFLKMTFPIVQYVLYTVQYPSLYELDKYFQDITILTFSHQNLNIKKKKKKFHFVFFCKRIASFCILLYTVPVYPSLQKKLT